MNLVVLMDAHPGLAAWVQAVGTILAVASGFAVIFLQNHLARREREADRDRFEKWAANLSLLVIQSIGELLRIMVDVERRRKSGEVFSNTEFGVPFLGVARDQILSAPPTQFRNPMAAHMFITLAAIVERALTEAEAAAPMLQRGGSINHYIESVGAAGIEAGELCTQLCAMIGYLKPDSSARGSV
ncbi:MAG: hypothetical protein JO276_04020 [Sphingomonadaceae bacterium]|nr:hypothetical protein [Sphingomonadaceae bacterium]